MLVTTGEHEATRWGFRMLLEMDCCDIIQPDVGWCGGITELIKISALADAHGVLVVPHGSSVYSYHFVVTRHNSPFAEFLMMAPKADEVVPMFTPQLLDEPVPENGRMKACALDKPGFGVRLNPECKLHRPHLALTPGHGPYTHRRQSHATTCAARSSLDHRRQLGHRRRGRARLRPAAARASRVHYRSRRAEAEALAAQIRAAGGEAPSLRRRGRRQRAAWTASPPTAHAPLRPHRRAGQQRRRLRPARAARRGRRRASSTRSSTRTRAR